MNRTFVNKSPQGIERLSSEKRQMKEERELLRQTMNNSVLVKRDDILSYSRTGKLKSETGNRLTIQ